MIESVLTCDDSQVSTDYIIRGHTPPQSTAYQQQSSQVSTDSIIRGQAPPQSTAYQQQYLQVQARLFTSYEFMYNLDFCFLIV
jgi:hypothetical protein